MHNAVIGACTQFGDYGRIKEQIIYLRGAYDMQSEVPPNFDDDATRLAYAVAYHPGHAFTYLSLLVRKTLGDAAFGGVNGSPSVLILGAGPGAETLAILRWMEAVRPELLDGARFVMVDRAEWQSTRRSVLAPTVIRSWKEHGIRFHQETTDISGEAGLDYLASEVPKADVIFCPSVFSELIAAGREAAVFESLLAHMAPTARLVLIDHKAVEFDHVSRQWSSHFSVLDEGLTLGAILPLPTMWLTTKFLDGSPDRIPTRKYPLLWWVLGPGLGVAQNRG
ncbi:MAG: hypothetical protein ACO36A_03855 [Ilumatobacteraceae bacterium]